MQNIHAHVSKFPTSVKTQYLTLTNLRLTALTIVYAIIIPKHTNPATCGLPNKATKNTKIAARHSSDRPKLFLAYHRTLVSF